MEATEQKGVPIVVGVTGHRDLRPGDEEKLSALVRGELLRIRESCPHTKIVLLSSLAEGADTLCARVADALSIPVLAALPMERAEYEKDFTGAALTAFRTQLSRAADAFTVPHAAGRAPETRDEAYRQAGIYVARHCHVLLALWDGVPDEKPGGCGTAAAVDCMLRDSYKRADERLHTPEDGAVLHIVTPRQKSGAMPADAFSVHTLIKSPEILPETLARTDAYNADATHVSDSAGAPLFTGATVAALPARLRRMHAQYRTADALAMRFRDRYLAALKRLSATGVLLMLLFLLYDEGEANLFLLLYALVAIWAFAVFLHARRGEYHRKYLEYRFFAEMLRVQLCLFAGGARCEASTLLSRAQVTQLPWVHDAMQAQCIGAGAESVAAVDIERIWIDDQLRYHTRTCGKLFKSITAQRRISSGMTWLSVAFFLLVCALEFGLPRMLLGGYEPSGRLSAALLMHDGATLGLRSGLKILLGVIPAVALFLSSYYGKLSLARKLDDRRRMVGLFTEAKREYNAHPEAREAILTELAREELSEAGGWLTYCSDNQLDVLL